MMHDPIRRFGEGRLLASAWYAYLLEHYAFPGVLVLCYHGMRPRIAVGDLPFANLHCDRQVFEEHCRMIADTCHPIDLDDLLRRPQHGERCRPVPCW